MTSTVIYKGALRTEMVHVQSGSKIENDAPTDNQGKGERFSPTDMVATALASCMLTTIGIKAQLSGWDIQLEETSAEVTKIMKSEPRRIGGIKVHIHFPAHLVADDKLKKIIENTALACPVAKSLHPDTELDVQFTWAS